MDTNELINYAIEKKADAELANINEGWQVVYYKQYRRAWEAARDAIKAEVIAERPHDRMYLVAGEVGRRLEAAGLPQSI